jgi:hypothetical protein
VSKDLVQVSKDLVQVSKDLVQVSKDPAYKKEGPTKGSEEQRYRSKEPADGCKNKPRNFNLDLGTFCTKTV